MKALDFGREARSFHTDVEIRRASPDVTTVTFRGYAALYGVEYPVYGGPDEGGWTEVFERGAFKRTLGIKQNRALLHSHDDGRPLATTNAGSLRLIEDERGLLVEADLDTRVSWINDAVIQIEAGVTDEMSHRFRALNSGQRWNDDYTHRSITEAQLFEVSVLWAGANPSTLATVERSRSLVAELRSAVPAVDRVRVAAAAALAALR
jgi:HK97 family phage prohead protease